MQHGALQRRARLLLSAHIYTSYQVASLLQNTHQATHHQENYFFDGASKELSKERAVLRVRFYNQDRKCTITLKGKSVIVDGIGRASELEDTADPITSRRYLQHPGELLALQHPVMQAVRDTYHPDSGLVCLGGFRNVRQVFTWEGFTLELDETGYEWGTVYEIEVETTEPEVGAGRESDGAGASRE